jgi:multidrug efflux system membrane fusion protein
MTSRTAIRFSIAIVAAATLLAFVPASGSVRTESPTRPIQAFTRPSSDLQLAFNTSGKVMQTLVEPGDRVEAGQPLIRLDDREARIRVRMHELRSRSTATVDAANATLELHIDELAILREALANDGANVREVARQQLEVERARASVLIEKLKQEESEFEFEAAAINLEKFTLTAPVAGFVEIILPRAGETVEALNPVLRLVTTDPLEIEAAVPARAAQSLARGSTVWVSLDLEGHERFRPAKVRSLSQVADGGTATRIIRIALPNPEGLPAGILAEVRLTEPAASLLAQTE